MWRAVLILCIGLTLARPAKVAAAPQAVGDGGGPEFEVTVPSVWYQVRRDFVAPKGYSRGNDPGGSEVRPRLALRPLRGSPILSAEPRVRLTRLTSEHGVDMLASGVRVAFDRTGPDVRPRFVFPAWKGVPHLAGYERSLSPWNMTIPMRRLPARIEVMEGEMTVEVVEEDATRELVVGPEWMEAEIVPGVRLTFHPGGGLRGQGELMYEIDGARTQGRKPILNSVMVEGKGHASIFPFKMDEMGRGHAMLELGIGAVRGMAVRAHVVYATREVTVTFRLENVTITGHAGAASRTNGAQSVEMVSEADGYEVRLTRLTAFGGTQGVGDRRFRQEPELRLTLGVLDTTEKRTIARFGRCRVEEIIDESGRALERLGEQAVEDDRSGGEESRFLPRSVVRVGGGNTADTKVARMLWVRVPLRTIPDRLARVRGRMEFVETTREVVREVELKTMTEPLEIAPGVRVMVRKPATRTDGRIPEPPEDWVELVVDLSPAEAGRRRAMKEDAQRTDMGGPWLSQVQFVDAEGRAGTPENWVQGRMHGDQVRYALGTLAFAEQAARMRIQVVLESVERSVPFEFEDVPCGVE